MRYIIFTILLLMVVSVSNAQQEAHYTHFMYNTLALNPGVAGSKGYPTILALYRKQWLGFDNAPESKLISFHTPLGSRVGFGVSITQDQLGISNTWYGSMAYSYRIQIDEETTVQVGIQGSMRYLGLDFNDVFILEDNDPAVLENSLARRYVGNFGTGVYLNVKQMFFGASVPNLFPNNIGINRDDSETATEVPHFYLMAGALIPVTDDQSIALRPSALAKIVNNAPFDLDLNLSVVFNQSFIAGLSYRLGGTGPGESLDLLLHYKFNNIGVGVSYDYTLSSLNDYNNGSIEAIVLYDFVKERADIANPRFFF